MRQSYSDDENNKLVRLCFRLLKYFGVETKEHGRLCNRGTAPK